MEKKRTKDGKGVTIASQQRYIRYYEYCLKNLKGLVPKAPTVILEKLFVTTVPKISGPQHVEIEIDNIVVHKSTPISPKKGDDYEIPVGGEIRGDCKIQLWVKTERLCHFWINTGFYDSEPKLIKDTIDVANKDKSCSVFKKDFSVTPHFALIKKPESSSSEDKKKTKKDGGKPETVEKGDAPTEKPEKGTTEEKESKEATKNDSVKKPIRSSKPDKFASSDSKTSDKTEKAPRKKQDSNPPKTEKRKSTRGSTSNTGSGRKSRRGEVAGTKTVKPPKDAGEEDDESPEPEVKPEVEEEPPAKIVVAPTPEETVSPRNRDHAKSFYKYSDYKEVIEKMKSVDSDGSDEDSYESSECDSQGEDAGQSPD
jgi:hypothetical protein